jgi:DNA-binding transcriptional MerR regulator
MAETAYRIGEVAERTGFPLTTLRYYEQQGVLPPPERSPAGQRLYREHHVERLALIGRAKRLGLTLQEAAVLADAWQHQQCTATHEQLVALLEAKLADVREALAEMTRFAEQLQDVYDRVADGSPTHEQCGPGCGCAPALAGDTGPETLAPGGVGRGTPPPRGGP